MTDLPRPQTRFHVTADLAAGLAVALDEGQAHQVRSVLRLDRGAHVALFNGRDGEWLARLDGVGKGWASAVPVACTRPQVPEPDLWLVFAPIKRARLDFLSEKATELGVSLLWPVFTRHTAVERVNLERLGANAREAAEQTGRLGVPLVRPVASLRRLAVRPVCETSATGWCSSSSRRMTARRVVGLPVPRPPVTTHTLVVRRVRSPALCPAV